MLPLLGAKVLSPVRELRSVVWQKGKKKGNKLDIKEEPIRNELRRPKI